MFPAHPSGALLARTLQHGATGVETNQHCPLARFERAQQLLEQGKFKNTEPEPYRIFAVYSTEWP